MDVSIHAFRGEGDRDRRTDPVARARFNPRLPGGRRPAGRRGSPAPGCFNPRLPGGRRRFRRNRAFAAKKFQSTPSGGKATERIRQDDPDACVSIHAFRGEGDVQCRRLSPRRSGFQSTPSGGKATNCGGVKGKCGDGFNPRLPGGRRRVGGPAPLLPVRMVSIHAFRGEGDRSAMGRSCTATGFQSTPSGGKATCDCGWTGVPPASVSIHAFRGEGDGTPAPCADSPAGFNPRLPGGRRRGMRQCRWRARGFQSTPSGGKATAISRVAMPCFRQIL